MAPDWCSAIFAKLRAKYQKGRSARQTAPPGMTGKVSDLRRDPWSPDNGTSCPISWPQADGLSPPMGRAESKTWKQLIQIVRLDASWLARLPLQRSKCEGL